ncbi:MAG TPA: zf-HC2 domain-containing protein [Marmoricola sp.]|nr:zf-HC2 domain-containing protein [Marmoricola sp.]
MILNLSGHIGSCVSALVDGQLSPQEEERAWQHVLHCAGCRRLVEREGWIKRRVSALSAPVSPTAPTGLLGALYDVDSWAAADQVERRSRRRRSLVAVGAGSVGVAVLGIVALTTPPAGRGEVPGVPPAATIQSDISHAGVSTPASLRRAPR